MKKDFGIWFLIFLMLWVVWICSVVNDSFMEVKEKFERRVNMRITDFVWYLVENKTVPEQVRVACRNL